MANLPENTSAEKPPIGDRPDGDGDGPVVIVAGPTASGKSRLAVDLAEAFSGEIVNADSMQVYADLAILSARPGADDLARAPHHLFGVLAAPEQGSAGWWLSRAGAAIAAIRRRRRLPIVCGGTGLYLKVLTEGLAPVPPVSDAAVAEARGLYDDLGGPAFRRRLAEIGAAARLAAGDRQRLVRAYAVVRATGRTLNHWQAELAPGPALAARFLTVLLDPPRDRLYGAIEERFRDMVAAGAVDEVRALLARLGDGAADPGLSVLKALGVPEIRRHLETGEDLHAALAAAAKATRHFAKRQVTWFRHQLSVDIRYDGFGGDAFTAIGPALARRLGGPEGR